ncbi:MAG: hypothetical protein Q4Q21_07235, partial [Lachnospiraceae bacterium]|nr:hypothetical protein [Lachnospiraceae bacterium]
GGRGCLKMPVSQTGIFLYGIVSGKIPGKVVPYAEMMESACFVWIRVCLMLFKRIANMRISY